jgi:3-phenylpropionate/cinnamic acid dioxygenase small subunit
VSSIATGTNSSPASALIARARLDLQPEIAQFLYYEARLLEDELFHAWLDLLTDDVRYWMPSRELVQGRSQRQVLDELEHNLSFTLFDDDRESLQMRVDRLDTGLAYAELPPSITQRLITTVEVFESDTQGEVIVHSAFLVRQVRPESGEDGFVGRREDRLRRTGEGWLGWKLARRKVVLAQPLLPRTVSILF